MRLYEVQGFAHLGSDELINEGIMDSLKKTLGSKIDQHVSVVKNTAQALQVFYKVGTDPEFLDTATFLVKKRIKAIIKSMGNNPVVDKIRDFVNKVWPQGRNLLDFIKAICLVGVMNLVMSIVNKVKEKLDVLGQIKDGAKDQMTNLILDPLKKLASVENALDQLSNVNGIFTILKTLGVADELIFSDLSDVNKKITSLPGGAT